MIAADPWPEYFLDRYGSCAIRPCVCLRDGWKGRDCLNWRTLCITSHTELLRRFLATQSPDRSAA